MDGKPTDGSVPAASPPEANDAAVAATPAPAPTTLPQEAAAATPPSARAHVPAPEAPAAPARPKVVLDGTSLPAEEDAALRAEIVAALKTVYDPEIPADIYELGLIYDIAIDGSRNVAIAMTLTAPGCPVAGEMPKWVENAVNAVAGVAGVDVRMTFDPPWDMGRMSDEARLALNMF
jgi:FeS assembly SUF system protein